METALTDQRYWDAVWSFTDDHLRDAPRVQPGDPHQDRLDDLFCRYLAPGRRFLEIGAGGSPWPAYVAARYRADAWGVDFSAGGLAMAAAAAQRDKVRVSLVEGDFFDRKLLPPASFDVLYSGGFVEHFPDAAPLMERIAELLAPGGVVITAVPNLGGVNGLLQKWLDADCYARHIVFTPESLDAAHALGGLRPIARTRYHGVVDLGAVNFSRVAARLPAPALKLIWAGLSGSRKAAEAIAPRFGVSDGGRRFAPGLLGIYSR